MFLQLEYNLYKTKLKIYVYKILYTNIKMYLLNINKLYIFYLLRIFFLINKNIFQLHFK